MQHSIITGGAGFIGSHLADLLLSKGGSVTIIDNLQTGSRDNLTHLLGNARCRIIYADCARTSLWDSFVSKGDWIFHLAGSVGVAEVTDRAVHTRNNNVNTCHSILSVANQKGAKVLIASTSEVYGDQGNVSLNEEMPLHISVTQQGRSAYTISKLYSELLALEAAAEQQVHVVIARFFNTTGPRQTSTYGMVVPTFVRQVQKNLPLTIYGSGNQMRSFCHVADTVEAIYALSQCPEAAGQIFNIGDDKQITINELAHFIAQIETYTSTINYAAYPPGRDGGSDSMYRRPDLKKLFAYTNFEHKHSWQQAVRDVWAVERAVKLEAGMVSG
jgi:UDP-glucose 4-epimerase